MAVSDFHASIATPGKLYNIYIEGCIGEGKTTLCKAIADHLNGTNENNVIFAKEDVNETLMKEFYKNQKLVMPTFQVSMITSRIAQKMNTKSKVQEIRRSRRGDIYVINDTGFFSDNVFIKTGLEYGNMSTTVSNMLTDVAAICNSSIEPLIVNPTHVLLLHSSPEICFRNIQRRFEIDKQIPKEYIELLHKNYMIELELARSENPLIKFFIVDTKSGFANVDDVVDAIRDSKA